MEDGDTNVTVLNTTLKNRGKVRGYYNANWFYDKTGC